VIYVCVAARNNAESVGLLLWKLGRVFQEFPREFHMLVADDASTDGSRQVLGDYERALPMTLLHSERPMGRAATLERLLQDALGRTDRPKRDCVVTIPADYSVSPAVIPELVRRFESGADVVIGERTENGSVGRRVLRRLTPWLVRPGLSVPGVRDYLSGTCLVRLVTLKNCYRDRPDRMLDLSGPTAFVEFVARAAANARQIAIVPLPAEPVPEPRDGGPGIGSLALELYRAGRRLRIPAPDVPVQRVQAR
jgi:Glycosyl transferase family 2